MRDSSDSNYKVLSKDHDEVRIQNEDLIELMRTKERMLEDQMNQINSLKSQLADKDEDIRELGEAKAKYRDFYEDKLGIEIEATERAKAKYDESNQRLQELEDEFENLR